MAQNSTKTARKRGSGRPFQKGKSGNPGGRPKANKEFRRRARDAVDEHVLAWWIDQVATGGKDRLKCSELLAAYGYGRPTQSHAVETRSLYDILKEIDDEPGTIRRH